MPTRLAGVSAFRKAQILYAPAKAANAGGVAVSGLEMSQNSARMSWKESEVRALLQEIMQVATMVLLRTVLKPVLARKVKAWFLITRKILPQARIPDNTLRFLVLRALTNQTVFFQSLCGLMPRQAAVEIIPACSLKGRRLVGDRFSWFERPPPVPSI